MDGACLRFNFPALIGRLPLKPTIVGAEIGLLLFAVRARADIPMSILNVSFLSNAVSECLTDLKDLQASAFRMPQCTLTANATLLLIVSLVT